MLLVLALGAAVWMGGRAAGLPRPARGLLIGLLYVLVLALLVVLPEAHPLRLRLGGSTGVWLVIGGTGGLVWLYALALSRLRRAAPAALPEGDDFGPPPDAVLPSSIPASPIPASSVLPAADPATPDTSNPDMLSATPSPPDPDPQVARLHRYSRHILLREIGGPGQRRLGEARVLVVGAGGIGAPALLYLAAAGVGRITLVDDDRVALSNLQRQVIYPTAAVGTPKAQAAAQALTALNPDVAVTALEARLDADLAARIVPGQDLVIDGSDSFSTRAAVNRACVAAGVPLLSAAVTQWEGQVSLFDPARGAPCLACLFPVEPAPGLAPACAEAGVAGPLPGVIGTMAALEAVKLLTGAGQTLRGRLLLYDGLHGESRLVTVPRDPCCPVCGSAPALATGDGPA